MSAAAGTCVLIIDGRGPTTLSYPLRSEYEVNDGTLLDISLSQVNDTGIGLIMIDPRTIPAALRIQQTQLRGL
jgi:hypothetical protein